MIARALAESRPKYSTTSSASSDEHTERQAAPQLLEVRARPGALLAQRIGDLAIAPHLSILCAQHAHGR
jgi:hypothetical protein